jgi:hypothetical protein
MNDISNRRFAEGSWPIEAPPDEVILDFSTPGRRPRIGVLINPLSGGNRNGLAATRNTIAGYPQVVQSDVQTPQDVLNALLDFARKDVNLVAVSGGDGTVQAVLTALFHNRPFEKFPLLTVLQSGTASMTARDVGFLGSQVKALQKLFRWAQTGDGKPSKIRRPVLRVAAPGHPIRYGMFFGAAAIYQGIQYFHRNVNGRGFRGEVGPGLTILRFLWALVCTPIGAVKTALCTTPPSKPARDICYGHCRLFFGVLADTTVRPRTVSTVTMPMKLS